MKLGIGIDTGGTYTDAVVYDFEDKKILGSAKSLTTRSDLAIGILGAIDGLPIDLVRQTEIISLSTTLATNACVEDKGGRAKLIFFGGDKKVIDQYGKQYGLPSSDNMYIQESFGRFSGGADREPDWELFSQHLEKEFEDLDGVGIIEVNAARNGALTEKKAKKLFQERYKIPVVCGHELFSELNCLQRGASTLLNARLFPVISEFLASVKKTLELRDIHPSAIVIVRSDGSLMSEEFAALHPVETLICGPAASAMGCTRLTDEPNMIVVDMGGTTTDIALVRDREPVTAVGGVSIGKWRTFVNGLYVKTFGLGGDSAVHYAEGKLCLEEYRVIPLCVAAHKYPSVLADLRQQEKRKHTRFLYEHYVLIKDIGGNARYTEQEQAFCAALKERPLMLSEAAAAVGKDIYTLNVSRLIKDGVVQLCGLTPTDIMHIRGDFKEYEAQASLLGAEFVAYNLGISVEELCEQVYDAVKRKLYVNIVKTLLENKYPHYMKNGVDSETERFISEAYEEAKTGKKDGLCSVRFHTQYSLIGAGAPICVFLRDVAEMLGTQVVIPENYEVANALGAIVGSVGTSCSIEVKPGSDASGASGYMVFGNDYNVFFDEQEDAVAFAASEAEERARAEAEKRGARGEVEISVKTHTNNASARDSTVYLGTTVTAYAVGAISY